jgi:hypothetical protein
VFEVDFGDGAPTLRVKMSAQRPRVGEIDPRVVSNTNEPPRLSEQEAAGWSWAPDDRTWSVIRKRSVERPATVTITGFRDKRLRQQTSSGTVAIRTSKDPVGSPIFYRDVPLMPSELEKGVIKPLAQSAVPLIAWRLRNVGEPRSRVVLERMHTCANCHSFSNDGRMLGWTLMDRRTTRDCMRSFRSGREPPLAMTT